MVTVLPGSCLKAFVLVGGGGGVGGRVVGVGGSAYLKLFPTGWPLMQGGTNLRLAP